jgi:hypothetical protein
MASLIGLFYWSPWKAPTDQDWLQTYEGWSEEVEATLASGTAVTRPTCEAQFDETVGDPPGERLDQVAVVAREGCAALTTDGWQAAQDDVARSILDLHATAPLPETLVPEPQRRPAFAALASPVAGRAVNVYCWPAERWAPFLEDYAILVANDEISLKGIADETRERIDLEPGVCTSLGRYVQRKRPIEISFENFQMAEAIAVLTHQAEHLKSPDTSELEVECYAVQHVRPFIAAAGWDVAYQTELARQAWDLGYTQLPAQLQLPECRDGGQLDRNPASSDWP